MFATLSSSVTKWLWARVTEVRQSWLFHYLQIAQSIWQEWRKSAERRERKNFLEMKSERVWGPLHQSHFLLVLRRKFFLHSQPECVRDVCCLWTEPTESLPKKLVGPKVSSELNVPQKSNRWGRPRGRETETETWGNYHCGFMTEDKPNCVLKEEKSFWLNSLRREKTFRYRLASKQVFVLHERGKWRARGSGPKVRGF